LRGQTLARYGQDEILSIEDVTLFVREQGERLHTELDDLSVPEENVYQATVAAARNVGVD
jgi:hypothetical protein